jgi:hypothetical protein
MSEKLSNLFHHVNVFQLKTSLMRSVACAGGSAGNRQVLAESKIVRDLAATGSALASDRMTTGKGTATSSSTATWTSIPILNGWNAGKIFFRVDNH